MKFILPTLERFSYAIFAIVMAILTIPPRSALSQDGAIIKAIIEKKSPEEIKKIIDANPNDLNSQDAEGRTALHWAVKNHDTDILNYLLSKNANPNIQNSWQNTPLILALTLGHKDMAQRILGQADNNGMRVADVTLKNKWQSNALLWAVRQGYNDIAQLILGDGRMTLKDINQQNKFGSSALMWATRKDNLEQAVLLVSKGADVNLVHKSNKTALDFTKDNNNLELKEFIEEVRSVADSCPKVQGESDKLITWASLVAEIVKKTSEKKTGEVMGPLPGLTDQIVQKFYENLGDLDCSAAGWPGKIKDGQCIIDPHLLPVFQKASQAKCGEGKILCNPAVFGPGSCVDGTQATSETSKQCLEKAKGQDDFLASKNNLVTMLLEQKGNAPLSKFAEKMYEANQLISGLAEKESSPEHKQAATYKGIHDLLTDALDIFDEKNGTVKQQPYTVDDLQDLHDNIWKKLYNIITDDITLGQTKTPPTAINNSETTEEVPLQSQETPLSKQEVEERLMKKFAEVKDDIPRLTATYFSMTLGNDSETQKKLFLYLKDYYESDIANMTEDGQYMLLILNSPFDNPNLENEFRDSALNGKTFD